MEEEWCRQREAGVGGNPDSGLIAPRSLLHRPRDPERGYLSLGWATDGLHLSLKEDVPRGDQLHSDADE